jgi:general secretion pathway protein G
MRCDRGERGCGMRLYGKRLAGSLREGLAFFREGPARRRRSLALRRLRAFTLLELMIVIVILGILAAFVVPKLAGRPEDARVVKAKVEIAGLETALEMYNTDNGSYPTTEQGLRALVERPETGDVPNWKAGGYLNKKKPPVDPWGNPYIYLSPGVQNEGFDLFSLGKGGKEGGEGYEADITNWE